jgi:hypothetical protein
MAHHGTEEEFWTTLAAAPDFSPAKVTEVKATFALSKIALGHKEMVGSLQSSIWDTNGVPRPERAAAKTMAEWLSLIETAGVPEGVPGDTDAERKQAYAEHLYRAAEIEYPTTRISARVHEDPGANEGDIDTFLQAPELSEFRFEETKVDDFLTAHASTIEGLQLGSGFADQLKAPVGKLKRLSTVQVK